MKRNDYLPGVEKKIFGSYED